MKRLRRVSGDGWSKRECASEHREKATYGNSGAEAKAANHDETGMKIWHVDVNSRAVKIRPKNSANDLALIRSRSRKLGKKKLHYYEAPYGLLRWLKTTLVRFTFAVIGLESGHESRGGDLG